MGIILNPVMMLAHIIPSFNTKHMKVVACPYKDVQGNDPGYWVMVGTIDAF